MRLAPVLRKIGLFGGVEQDGRAAMKWVSTHVRLAHARSLLGLASVSSRQAEVEELSAR